VSVVIPARDAAATLPRALEALERQRGVRFSVIVVDDGSEDDTAAIAEAASVVDRVVRLDGVGISGARAAGVEHASAPVLAFTDADCYPAPDWLEQGLRALGAADLVQGRVVPARPTRPFERTIRVGKLTWMFETANLFVRRAAFEAVGGMEPGFLPSGGKEIGEDVWLGWRIRRAGYRIRWAPEALVEHEVFERGPVGYAASRWRLRSFPGMAARIPELREEVMYLRYFHSQRSAFFDLALAGAALARRTRSKRPLLLAVPYALRTARDVRRTEPRLVPSDAAARVAADAVGFVALVRGSVAHRSVLL
jgi:glycosyltransferase involved in cell wall biosynthesis